MELSIDVMLVDGVAIRPSWIVGLFGQCHYQSDSTKRKRFNFARTQNDEYLQQLLKTVYRFSQKHSHRWDSQKFGTGVYDHAEPKVGTEIWQISESRLHGLPDHCYWTAVWLTVITQWRSNLISDQGKPSSTPHKTAVNKTQINGVDWPPQLLNNWWVTNYPNTA